VGALDGKKTVGVNPTAHKAFADRWAAVAGASRARQRRRGLACLALLAAALAALALAAAWG
jgi:hypothetical protein